MGLSDENNPLSFLSDTRQEYVHCYEKWHASGESLCMPFPLRERKFPAPGEMCVAGIGTGERVVASVASIPKRVRGLERVVGQILPQVDRLNVHLNHYEIIPEFLRHEKIRVTRSQETGDLRDNGKFLKSKSLRNAFHLTLDDDLIYPKFYVSYLCSKIMQYGRKAIVGLHGTRLKKDFEPYHDGRSRITNTFYLALKEDELVHVLGTGTTGYHVSTLDFTLDDIGSTGMVDLWLAAAAKDQSVPMVSIARGRGWLVENKALPSGSLYEEYRSNDEPQTKFVLENQLNQAIPKQVAGFFK